MTKPKTTVLDAYKTYLPELTVNGNQAIADCPWCQKENHFYISPKTGQSDCKSCGASGNLYTFLQDWYTACLEETTSGDRKELSELRDNFPPEAFAQVARDGHRWLIPSYNREGSFANLRLWIPGQSIHSTATCSVHLLGIEQLKPDGLIYLVEGDWDYFTLSYLLSKFKNRSSVLGVPGASTFKNHWVEYFQEREVVLLYDKDNSGSDGMDKVCKKLKGKVRSIQRVEWPEAMPKGYDISDFVLGNLKRPKKAITELLAACTNAYTSNPEDREERQPSGKKANLKKIIAAHKKFFRIGKQEVDAITLTHAVIASVQIPEDSIWLFIVGPPGSGKTALLSTLEDSPQCISRSRVTPASLCSGFITNDQSDPSLIPRLTDLCLIMKDWTEIESMSQTDKEKIYGIFRGAHDGKVEVEFGNGVHRIYPDCWFSLVAGVTPIIHGDNRATLGERFLKFELVQKHYDPTEQIRAAMSKVGRTGEAKKDLTKAVSEYSEWEVDTDNLPKVPKWVMERVLHLAQVIAILRASVDRTFKGDLAYRPQVEIGTRLAAQLIKLAICISIVQEKPISKETYRLVKKVAMDTAIGWGLEIMLLLVKSPKQPRSRRELEEAARIPSNTLIRKLEDLVQIGAIDRISEVTEGRGRPSFSYLPSKQLIRLWKAAKLDRKD